MRRHPLKSIRWYQWMMKIPQLIITTKDGYGFSSLGVLSMFILIFQILWNFSLVVAAKAEIQAFIFPPQRKMNWQKQHSKSFMQQSKDPKRPTQTETNPSINHRPLVLWMLLWRRSLQQVKNRAQELAQTKTKVDCFLQLFPWAQRMEIKQLWLMEVSMADHTHSRRPWLLEIAQFLLEKLLEAILQASFLYWELIQTTENPLSRH